MKPSERRLIAILCVLAAISGGAIMSQMLLRKQSSLGRRQQTLELKRIEAEAMLSEAALWKARLDWLKANQPSMSSENQASQELLDEVLAAAAKQKLTVQKKQLHEATQTSFFREVGVTLTLSGDLPDVFRWLHGLLAPESFRMVSYLKILPDAQEASKVTVIARVNRRHAPALTTVESPTKEEAGS